MLNIKKRSKWKFETSSGTGFSVGDLIAITGGKSSFVATAPEGDQTKFHYVSAGGGVGIGGKVSIGGSDESFPSAGIIYILSSFKGTELKYKDFTGMCLIVEASVGMLNGVSGTVMLLGMPESFRGVLKNLARGATGQYEKIVKSAKALLMMGGLTQGANISAGVTGSVGHVWAEVIPVDPPKIDGLRGSPEDTTTRSALPAKVVLAGDVLFDFDKDTLGTKERPGDAVAVLTRAGSVVKYVKDIPEAKVRVEGHTDAIGTAAYNQGLSMRRAERVSRWLIGNGYLPAERVSWKGFGATRPIASNRDAAGRAQNRRVEIFVDA